LDYGDGVDGVSDKHRNDIYGDLEKTEGSPAIPAATVVLIREKPELEVLMLKKTANISFGGMWVFPGGKIDPADYDVAETDDPLDAAKAAAVRETMEETGLSLTSNEFVWFAHWTPPPSTPKRYATWFFLARLDDDDDIQVDGEEILKHQWIRPSDAHALHAEGKIDLAPPTWITLHQLALYERSDELLGFLQAEPARHYETKIVLNNEGQRVALWSGDSAYETGNADADGGRHRLVLGADGFVFENTVARYRHD
jgi:8-oxo-dGTP pyrophosphatase MutT (NUDIX family)